METKTFKVNFGATINRKGANRQTGEPVIAPQSIGEYVNDVLLRLRTFKEVAETKQLREKVKQSGEQTLSEAEFAVIYQTLLNLNSDEKEQIMTVLSETGIDILKYEAGQKS